MSYGRVTHYLMRARELLHDQQPRSPREARLHAAARIYLDTTIAAIRFLYHRAHRWGPHDD